ncbi:helix-turn-helix domain-containing protein [Hephaestia caeni]|uniref:helix-turn-helix domain-containing protein n=1 Tax=Hephaestia caeni TaxID=645617 RepID=UPI000E5A27C8|nr:helix-turn-helix domain-containing protein [Hephaestia caeni]
MSIRRIIIEGEFDSAAIAKLRDALAATEAVIDIEKTGGSPRVAEIVDRVGFEMGLRPIDIMSRRNFKALGRGRAAVSWIAREATLRSLPQIGRAMGRDHSTVIHQLRRAEALRAADPAFRRLTDRLAEEFSGEQA